MIDWLTSIASSAVTLAVGAFLAKTVLAPALEKSIQSRFDSKLEALKSDLRKDEETYKQQIRAQDDKIAALRSGALSNMATRNAIIDKRRIEAIESLWQLVVDKHEMRYAARMAQSLRMDKLMERAAGNSADADKIKEFGDMLFKMTGQKSDKGGPSGDIHRPFLSPISWALFSAHASVLGYIGAQFYAVKTGIGAGIFADPKPIIDMVKAALPHQSDLIDKYGVAFLAYLVDELEEKILDTLMKDLRDPEFGLQTVAQATAILKEVEKVAIAAAPPPASPV